MRRAVSATSLWRDFRLTATLHFLSRALMSFIIWVEAENTSTVCQCPVADVGHVGKCKMKARRYAVTERLPNTDGDLA
jgi:hypothetical protein